MSKLARIDLIDPSPWADLFPHEEEHVARLAEDIAERGIQTPLHVYPRGERYELLAGHDRLEAAKRCGLSEVPIETRMTLTNEDERFAYFVKDNTLRKDADGTRRLAHMGYTLDRKLWLRISDYHGEKAREHQHIQRRTWEHAMQMDLFAAA